MVGGNEAKSAQLNSSEIRLATGNPQPPYRLLIRHGHVGARVRTKEEQMKRFILAPQLKASGIGRKLLPIAGERATMFHVEPASCRR